AVRVVPGVSAALAAPAAAGIPLMLRQLSVTATFVDGNADPEHAAPPDWSALAGLGGTLVILTGRGRIRRTAAALIAGGRPPETPVAAISAAGRPEHRVLRGTLGALPAPLPPPVPFVVRPAAAIGAVTAVAGVSVCLRGAQRTVRDRDLPVAGLAAAFFLVGDAPMVPIT